jgi:hypothetical protein
MIGQQGRRQCQLPVIVSAKTDDHASQFHPAAVLVDPFVRPCAQGNNSYTVFFGYVNEFISGFQDAAGQDSGKNTLLWHDTISGFFLDGTSRPVAFFSYLRYFQQKVSVTKPVSRLAMLQVRSIFIGFPFGGDILGKRPVREFYGIKVHHTVGFFPKEADLAVPVPGVGVAFDPRSIQFYEWT